MSGEREKNVKNLLLREPHGVVTGRKDELLKNPHLLRSDAETALPESTKKELYAISILVLERIFPDIIEWLEKDKDRLPGAAEKETETIPPFFLDTPVMKEKFSRNPFTATIEVIEKTSFGPLTWLLLEYKSKSVSEQDEFFRDAFRRMNHLLRSNTYRPFDATGVRGNLASQFIVRGANTGYRASWDMTLALPLVWRKTFGDDISEHEFRDVMHVSETTASLISSMHFDDFAGLLPFASDKTQNPFISPLNDKGHFPPDFFSIEPFKGSHRLVLREDLVREWSEVSKNCAVTDFPRLGCPGRDAKITYGKDKSQSVIGYTLDYVTGIALRTILPRCSAFVDSAEQQLEMREKILREE